MIGGFDYTTPKAEGFGMSTTHNAEETRRSQQLHDAESHENEHSNHETVTDKVVKAAKSEDEPMGRETPEAPFALVGLSYLAALAVVVLVIAGIIYMTIGG